MERHAEPLGDRLAVAVVGDEELQHGRRLAERGDALHRLGHVQRVHEPHTTLVRERVRRAAAAVVDDPGDPQRMFG